MGPSMRRGVPCLADRAGSQARGGCSLRGQIYHRTRNVISIDLVEVIPAEHGLDPSLQETSYRTFSLSLPRAHGIQFGPVAG